MSTPEYPDDPSFDHLQAHKNRKVASNTSLVELLRLLDAESLKVAIIDTIEAEGLTFGQREFFRPVTDKILEQVRARFNQDLSGE